MWKPWKTEPPEANRGSEKELFERILAAESAIRKLEDRADSIERMPKMLEMEWNEVYDKINHLMGRISKRARALEGLKEGSDEPQNDEPAARPAVGHHDTLRTMRARHGLLPR